MPLELTLEKEKFQFKPGERKLIKNLPKNERYAMSMRAFVKLDDKWKRIESSLLSHPGNKRVIKVAFYNDATKQVEISGVRDISILGN